MINQYQQAAIAELQEFIDNRPDAREVRKALAVKLVYQGYKYEEIQTILDVSKPRKIGDSLLLLAQERSS
jgi:putative transposase